jgi:hypothetical protein
MYEAIRRSIDELFTDALFECALSAIKHAMSYSAEAQEKREMAARARCLAGCFTAEGDREGCFARRNSWRKKLRNSKGSPTPLPRMLTSDHLSPSAPA